MLKKFTLNFYEQRMKMLTFFPQEIIFSCVSKELDSTGQLNNNKTEYNAFNQPLGKSPKSSPLLLYPYLLTIEDLGQWLAKGLERNKICA